MSIDFDQYGYTPVKPEDNFSFQCALCGDCCRNVKDSIMLESLDLFRLARFLGLSMEDTAEKYADVGFIADNYPILVLKTKQHMDACVFLKSSKCSVYDARPRACRTYPLGIGPDDEKPGEFLSFIVSKRQHHFTGTRRRVGDWIGENFTPEDGAFVTADYNMTGEIGKLMRKIDKSQEEQALTLILIYKYFEYDTERDFTEQYLRNMACLKGGLLRLADWRA